MEENPTSSQQPVTAPPLKPSVSESSRPFLSLKPIYIALVFIFGILLGAGGLFAYQEILTASEVATYEECVKANGSQQLLIYPGVCVTRDGQRFTQPLTDEEKRNLVPPDGTPTPSCRPRPKCLDQEPRCLMPETDDMCPPESTFPVELYTCPKTEWVDCMPGPNQPKKIECTSEFLTWAKANCPGFEGAAL